MRLLTFWLAHRRELGLLLEQHVMLVLVSTTAAIVVGVPAGILAVRRPRIGDIILTFASVAQTIPSLALLGFLLPLPVIGGIGPRTALVALSIYALLPIVRNTVVGLRSIDPAILEAGIAMGMTQKQLLMMVEFPLALPSIVAGARVSTVIGVGTATIAAAIGAGGLGEYIFRGLAMVDTTTILAGAVPAALLALVADALLGLVERRARPARATGRAVPALAAVLVTVMVATTFAYSRSGTTAIVVGSKNFTEQVVLGELVAQTLEAEGARVVRKLNLGGTFVCDRGVRTGDLDAYVEYTGTAVSAVFHQPVPRDSQRAMETARQLYARDGLSVLAPLGFNNTFTILVRERDASQLGLHTIDDLRRVQDRWTPGFGYEFLQRDDGYPGLVRAYDLRFASQPRAMDLSLIYRALAEGQVDVIAGDATSALIGVLHLTPLQDNRSYFPPYDAVPVVRTASLLRQPVIGRAFARLAGRVTDADMRALNAAVDLDHRDVGAVVHDFLQRASR